YKINPKKLFLKMEFHYFSYPVNNYKHVELDDEQKFFKIYYDTLLHGVVLSKFNVLNFIKKIEASTNRLYFNIKNTTIHGIVFSEFNAFKNKARLYLGRTGNKTIKM